MSLSCLSDVIVIQVPLSKQRPIQLSLFVGNARICSKTAEDLAGLALVSLSHRFVIRVLGVSSCEDRGTRGEAEKRENEGHGKRVFRGIDVNRTVAFLNCMHIRVFNSNVQTFNLKF